MTRHSVLLLLSTFLSAFGGTVSPATAQDTARVPAVIVTATRSGQEGNDTVFYEHFLEALKSPTADEDKDRNKNGIIDSIDDTLDLIKELQAKGYPDENITYLLLEEGKHDVETWGKAMPFFLRWAFY